MNLYSDVVWPSLNRVIIYQKSALLRLFNITPKGGSGKTQSSKISLEQFSNIPREQKKKAKENNMVTWAKELLKAQRLNDGLQTTKDSKGKTRMIDLSSNEGWKGKKVEKG